MSDDMSENTFRHGTTWQFGKFSGSHVSTAGRQVSSGMKHLNGYSLLDPLISKSCKATECGDKGQAVSQYAPFYPPSWTLSVCHRIQIAVLRLSVFLSRCFMLNFVAIFLESDCHAVEVWMWCYVLCVIVFDQDECEVDEGQTPSCLISLFTDMNFETSVSTKGEWWIGFANFCRNSVRSELCQVTAVWELHLFTRFPVNGASQGRRCHGIVIENFAAHNCSWVILSTRKRMSPSFECYLLTGYANNREWILFPSMTFNKFCALLTNISWIRCLLPLRGIYSHWCFASERRSFKI